MPPKIAQPLPPTTSDPESGAKPQKHRPDCSHSDCPSTNVKLTRQLYKDHIGDLSMTDPRFPEAKKRFVAALRENGLRGCFVCGESSGKSDKAKE